MQVQIPIECEVLHDQVLVVQLDEGYLWVDHVLSLLIMVIDRTHKSLIGGLAIYHLQAGLVREAYETLE